jgi:lysophospholipase L1-like esterase
MNKTKFRSIAAKVYIWVVTLVLAFAAYVIAFLTDKISHLTYIENIVWVRHDFDKNIQLVPEALKGVHTWVCFGDSITRGGADGGYVGALKKYISAVLPEQKIEIVNSGVDGDTTRNLLKRIDHDVFAHNPELVTVMIGVNDVAKGYEHQNRVGNGPKGVPLEEYKSNIKSILSQAKAHNEKVILISPGIIIENLDHPANSRLGEYTQALEQIAKENGIQYIDVHKAFTDIIAFYRKETGGADCLLTRDGTHPNSAGSKVLANCILNGIGITTNSRAAVQKDSPW